ncbi:hypothetical protein BP6252_04692 [Coleophoma cylindrospora]|uniref:Uncharacterized protein n=1 Tax=Coleophoma cylindrospora TaxID=1849047 RepID=A0A3D8S1U0_9HELO|nr:hypothetical protein BP6252_04692 [Coleophoma cylindrospora]
MSRTAANGAARAVSSNLTRIKDYASVPFIRRGNKIPGLTAKFAPDHHYVHSTSMIVQLKHHHIHERTKQAWQARTDPLWWSCIMVPSEDAKKRVIRSHLTRKLRQAFVESLKKEGYAKDGTRLPDSTQEMDLVGTLQMSAEISLMKMGREEAQKSTDELVKAMLEIRSKARQPEGRKNTAQKRGKGAENAALKIRRI